jgi:hypothetical protein
LAGVAIGLGVGVVSSVLGVAGGELLIPALVFVFGADIKTAGTASLMISLAIVAMGCGAITRRERCRCAADHSGSLCLYRRIIDRRCHWQPRRRLCARVVPQGAVLIVAAIKTFGKHEERSQH